MHYAVIDLGTNTFKLLVASVSDRGQIIRKHTNELGVKLGEEGIGRKEIAPPAFQRGIESLGELIREAKEFEPVNILVIGTSGIRSAINGNEFISKISSVYDVQVNVITGDEEAELIFRGVRQAVNIPDKPVLILDIGGGSNEFIIASHKHYLWKQSYDLGIARLLDRFQPSDPIAPGEIKKVNQFLSNELESLFEALSSYEINSLIGCAGTFETYRSILNFTSGVADVADVDRSPSFPITMQVFHELYEKLVFSTYHQRKQIPGLQLYRVEMIVLATIFVNFIIEKLGVKSIIQSDYALKEGAIDKIINP
jgi:exopolyphosphatase/guanosine-5'-triphosphate,3'-diphosphate pyrophosphatase